MLFLTAPVALAFPSHDEPHRVGARAPDDAAVVIGIEDYFALPDVPYAERDAQAVHDLLVYTLGVPADRVRMLTKDASKERIEAAVAEAAGLAGSTGTLWVYFAGHGAASPATGERVLLGIDTMADATSFEARSVSFAQLKEEAKDVSRAVLMVDACYSGAGRAGGELLAGKRFAVPSYAQAPETKWIEWNAAQPNELSGPLEPARHGAFTWAVVGALRGWADGQLDGAPDGVITFEEADLYVGEVLRAVDVNDQHPVLLASDATLAAVTLPIDRLEARPDAAVLRADVQAPAPAPQPAAPAPKGDGIEVKTSATAQVWRGVQCEPELQPPSSMRGQFWPMEPGVDPRATWTCKKPVLYLNRFPPAEGRTGDEMMVHNLATPGSLVPVGSLPKVLLDLPKRQGDDAAIDLADPTTWPSVPIATPRGELTGRVVPVTRRTGGLTAPGPFIAVEDDRQPGALYVCRVPTSKVAAWDPSIEACTRVLEGALQDAVPEAGRVR